jgi:preprotein translocase subunit SecD
MKRRVGLFFILICILTALAIVINLAQEYKINIDTTIPGINKKISIHQNFPGINPNFNLGPFHFQRDLSFKKGLDLEGGTSITLQADMKDVPSDQRDNALESAKNVIERRVNFFGVSEPVIQTTHTNQDYRILVEIPGVTDTNAAINLIGKTAKLTFWEEGASGSAKIASPEAAPIGITQLFPNPVQTDLTGSDLQQSSVSFDTNTGKPQVQLTFTAKGAEKFGDITKRNVGKILAIALDEQVIEAPRVNEPIYGGNAVITGTFTTDQAKALQIQLNAGALPVSLSVIQQQAIGATLGQESLQKSLLAGLLGFLVIVIFMIVLYGRLGIVASAALAIYTLLVLALFRLIPITLTLAGIAGLILSIGIAVDANILIFERMKEELRRGVSKDMAIDLGFSRAWSSIRDSNFSSLITSAILYYFGTGMVRGFALTLALGVFVSMFSAIFVTRTFLRIFHKLI